MPKETGKHCVKHGCIEGSKQGIAANFYLFVIFSSTLGPIHISQDNGRISRESARLESMVFSRARYLCARSMIMEALGENIWKGRRCERICTRFIISYL